jgi:hypothetical protein
MVHIGKHVAIVHPLYNTAKGQNVVFDVPAMGGGVLPCRQMAQVMLEEAVGRSKVKNCSHDMLPSSLIDSNVHLK